MRTPEETRDYLHAELYAQSAGTALPFVIQEIASGRIIGSTRFHGYQPTHRRIEIGFTWLDVHYLSNGRWNRFFPLCWCAAVQRRHGAFDAFKSSGEGPLDCGFC